MIGIYVSIPVACFRKGMAREYLETDRIPPPSTCYGFLLSLVGETDRFRHLGVRIAPVLLAEPEQSVVLRTTWREKTTKEPSGAGQNARPDYQELLTGVRLIVWLDSTEEENQCDPTLEQRVALALDPKHRREIDRFGGLSLGESTHLVDEVLLYDPDALREYDLPVSDKFPLVMLEDSHGQQTWPVWVDHVGAAKTRYVTGSLVAGGLTPPEVVRMPRIVS